MVASIASPNRQAYEIVHQQRFGSPALRRAVDLPVPRWRSEQPTAQCRPPLLTAAETVTVLTIDPREGSRGHGELPGADISLHLARHGVKAEIERTVSADLPVGEVLLSRVADLGADLLVMGAYGHSRARELLLGGATRSLLRSMTLPVLMSH